MVKVKEFLYNERTKQHIVVIEGAEVGIFGSKIEHKQKEKIEKVLNKRYIKLPFGLRLLW